MLKTGIVLLTVIMICALTWRWVRGACDRCDRAGHQFPTAYTLLKSSPEIDRRESIALRFIVALLIVHILLLLAI